jgi:hypothetical protein
MLQGQASKANEVWATFLKSLQAWMDQNQTDPLIIASIIHGLNKRRYPTGSTTTCHTSTLLAEDQQLDIGWGIMLEGWLTIEWELKQKAYFALLNSRRSSRLGHSPKTQIMASGTGHVDSKHLGLPKPSRK